MSGLRQSIRSWLSPQRETPVILMYHRIATPVRDPWGLAVSPDYFDQQLSWLKASRVVLAMDDFVAQLVAKQLPENAVAITFDDGYRDNLTQAKPLLEKHDLPATLFLATGFIDSNAPFWWDDLANMLLSTTKCRLAFDFLDEEISLPELEPADNPSWRVSSGSATVRQRVYLRCWEILRSMAPNDRMRGMAEVRSLLGLAPCESDAKPLTRHDITSLVSSGLISIGAHSVNHVPMSRLEDEMLMSEINHSRQFCAEITGQAINGFAYPFGDRSATAVRATETCGLHWACSTTHTSAARANRFDLPRVQVADGDAEHLASLLCSVR